MCDDVFYICKYLLFFLKRVKCLWALFQQLYKYRCIIIIILKSCSVDVCSVEIESVSIL